MPVVETPKLRDRILQLLKANPGRDFSMLEVSRALGCDLSVVPGHARAIAESDPDVYFVVPSHRGAGARVRFSPPKGK